MNSRQLNFYLNLEDQFGLNSQLECFEEIVFCKAKSPNGKPILLENTLNLHMGKEALGICLLRQSDLENIVFNKIKKLDIYSVDTFRSPIVEYSRCFVDCTKIRRGRFYFIKAYYDQRGNLIRKNERFISWAEKIIKEVQSELINSETGTRFGVGALSDKGNGKQMTFL